jgi:hypothetical protein
MDNDYIEICEIVRAKSTNADVVIGEIIYNQIFARDKARYRNWKTATYQAPETHEGFAFHLCIYTAIKIREQAAESEKISNERTGTD